MASATCAGIPSKNCGRYAQQTCNALELPDSYPVRDPVRRIYRQKRGNDRYYPSVRHVFRVLRLSCCVCLGRQKRGYLSGFKCLDTQHVLLFTRLVLDEKATLILLCRILVRSCLRSTENLFHRKSASHGCRPVFRYKRNLFYPSI